MLKLLLDEHISKEVAEGLRRRNRSLVVECLADWSQGELLGRDDALCLQEAEREGLTLVTYDRRTFPLLLKVWGEERRRHSGVILVDEKTISPADIGGLIRALSALIEEGGEWDWSDRVCMLRR